MLAKIELASLLVRTTCRHVAMQQLRGGYQGNRIHYHSNEVWSATVVNEAERFHSASTLQ